MAIMADARTTLMDGEYYVSAAALADKIIEHMWRGLDPLPLFAASPTEQPSRKARWSKIPGRDSD